MVSYDLEKMIKNPILEYKYAFRGGQGNRTEQK
jgi:hypothetical protein